MLESLSSYAGTHGLFMNNETRQIADQTLVPMSLVRALDLVGDPWALQIIKEAFLGTRRFQDFQSRLGITRQTLTIRLNRFTEEALMYKAPVHRGRLVYEYRLTPKGSDLYAFILTVWRWHKRWHFDEALLPARLVHRPCGSDLDPVMECAACHGSLSPETVHLRNVGKLRDQARRRPRIVNQLKDLGVNFLATVVIGDGWSIQVLTAVMRGVHNYDAMRKALGISSNVLSARLKTLVALDLLWTEVDANDGRMVSYRLSDKGVDIFPMILALIQWGDRWLAGQEGPQDILLHESCGALLEPVVYCATCRQRVRLEDVTIATPVKQKNRPTK